MRFKPALNSKGLRLEAVAKLSRPNGFKPALNSKGLRHFFGGNGLSCLPLQASPEFKGIKTFTTLTAVSRWLQASPEFKGIKTWPQRRARLIAVQASPEFKGIKTIKIPYRVIDGASSQP